MGSGEMRHMPLVRVRVRIRVRVRVRSRVRVRVRVRVRGSVPGASRGGAVEHEVMGAGLSLGLPPTPERHPCEVLEAVVRLG